MADFMHSDRRKEARSDRQAWTRLTRARPCAYYNIILNSVAKGSLVGSALTHYAQH